MLCILSALKAESEPLITLFRLKRQASFNFPVFLNKEIALVAIGVGKKKISSRINTFFLKFSKESIYFINIGTSGGHSEHTSIGNCYLINKIHDDLTKKEFYPDILIKHPFEEKDVFTVEAPVNNNGDNYPSLVDMEASEIFSTCMSLVPIHHLSFLKVVSDYTDLDDQVFDAVYIKKLFNPILDKIKIYFFDLKCLEFQEKSVLTVMDSKWLKTVSDLLSLTISQNQIIKNKVIGFRLKNPNKFLPQEEMIIPKSKQHQKQIFKQLNDQISI